MVISNMKCAKCEHEWETKSKLKLVTCPSCNLKVPNIKDDKKEDTKK